MANYYMIPSTLHKAIVVLGQTYIIFFFISGNNITA